MNRNPEEVLTELLVLRSQDGDVEAWKQLIELWEQRLYVHARRLTERHEVARDITQDAWVAMVRGIKKLDDPARFRAWAFRIVSNKAADWARKQVRRRKILEAARQEATRDEQDQRHASKKSGSNTDRVRIALRKLSRDQRALVSMFYDDGMELNEIASILGIPVGTVKSRLYSVRQELKGFLQQEGNTDER